MDNLSQILGETIKLLLAGVIGGLIGARANDKFTRRRDHDAVIAKDKKQFIFMIDELIETIKNCDMPHMVVPRFQKLYTPHLMFKPHVKSVQLAAYEEAWKQLQATTPEEAYGMFSSMDDPQLQKIQKLLISRLEAVKKNVQEF